MQMMEQAGNQGGGQGMDQQNKNQTLEINPAHPIIVNLNHLRKKNPTLASIVSKQMLDNVLLQSGIPFDTNAAITRSYSVLEKVLDSHLTGAAEPATRKLKAPQSEITLDDTQEDGEPILKKSQRDLKKDQSRKIVKDINVGEEHFK